ncbi:MAG: hypothetical protein AAGF12_16250 [Myxococcota bacterium]
MGSLARREVQALATFVPLALALAHLDLIIQVGFGRFGESVWNGTADWLEYGSLRSNEVSRIAWTAIAVVCAYLAYAAEIESLPFLHSLPTRRWKAFLAKVGIGGAFLCAMSLASTGTLALVLATNLQSVGIGVPTEALLALVVQRSVFLLLAYAISLPLSRMGVGGFVLIFGGSMITGAFGASSASFALLDPALLLLMPLPASDPWSTGLTIVYGTLALLLLPVGYLAWRNADRPRAPAKSIRSRLAKIGCFGALGLAGWLLAVGLRSHEPDGPEQDHTDAEVKSVERITTFTTAHFRFTYPRSQTERALPLIERSEALLQELRLLVYWPDIPRRIDVDLYTHRTAHAGIARGHRMRVSLSHSTTAKQLEKVFVHELAHVFQQAASKQGALELILEMAVFIEGGANYLAFEVAAPEMRPNCRRTAVLAWQRHQLQVQDLYDGAELRRRLGHRLAYAIGEMWVAAFVRVVGPRAIGHVLARLPANAGSLEPRERWQRLLPSTLGAVESEFEQMMRNESEDQRELIASTPVIRARAEAEGRHARIRVSTDRPLPAGARVMIAYRHRPESSPKQTNYTRAQPVEEGSSVYELEVRRPFGYFQYQPGIFHEEWEFFDEWRTFTVPVR